MTDNELRLYLTNILLACFAQELLLAGKDVSHMAVDDQAMDSRIHGTISEMLDIISWYIQDQDKLLLEQDG